MTESAHGSLCPKCGSRFSVSASKGQITCDEGCTWRACMIARSGYGPPRVVFSLIPLDDEIKELMTS